MKKIYSLLLLLAMLSLGLVACDDSDDVVKSPLDTPSVENDATKVSSLSFNWKQVAGATQYAYELYDADGNLVAGGVTTATSAIITGLKANTAYTLKVWAYAAIDGDKSTSPIATITATTAAVVTLDAPVPEAACVNGSITISWPEVENASSYHYSYTVDGKEIEGDTETNSVTLKGLAVGEYTINIYSVSDDEAFANSEVYSLTFKRAKSELWRKAGTYTSVGLAKSFEAVIVSYDDGSYTIESPIGVDGYSISFATLSDSKEITAVDPYSTDSYNYSYYYVSSEYYLAIYTAGGYSEFSGDKSSGEVWFYSYTYDTSGVQVGEGGYDDFTWGSSSESLTLNDLVGTYTGLSNGWYWSSDWVAVANQEDEVTITANSDGTVNIYNIFGWEDTFTATVDLSARTITVPSSTVWATYYTFADASSVDKDVVATINDDNTITFSNFSAWYNGSAWIAENATCVLTKKAKSITLDDIVGTYDAMVSGSDQFTDDWSVQTVERTDEVTISANTDGTVTISNFYDWGYDFTGVVDLEKKTITIEACEWGYYTFASTASSSTAVVATIGDDGSITFSDFTAWYVAYGSYFILDGTTCVMTKKASE